MANQVAIYSARNFIRQGGAFGNYVAKSYEITGDRIILVAECNTCGAKNRIPWANVSVEQRTPGITVCVNRERHPATAKPVKADWRRMTDAEFAKFERSLSSEAYRKLFASDEFTNRVNRLPKPMDMKQAREAKEAADKAAIQNVAITQKEVCLG